MKQIMKLKLISLALIVTMIFVTSCASTGANPIKRLEETKVETFDVRGEVVWEGDNPIVYPIATASYRGVCGKRKGIELLRLSSPRKWHKRIIDVAVWLEPIWEDMTPDEIRIYKYYERENYPATVEIEERQCEFVPRLTVVPSESRIEIINNDRKDHWTVVEGERLKRKQYVQIYDEAPPEFTLTTPKIHMVPEGAPIVLKTNKKDKISLQSGFHLWMFGWILVTDKKWYTKVNDDGYFVFENVPRGVYRVNTWHPLLGHKSRVVRIPDEAHDTISVGYLETPKNLEIITSTHITTAGEVRDEHNVWQEIEDW